jgi:lycopene beta-cyclase
LQQQYDYIIAGAGCAGLSLLHRMMMHPFFNQKKYYWLIRMQKTSMIKPGVFGRSKMAYLKALCIIAGNKLIFIQTIFLHVTILRLTNTK